MHPAVPGWPPPNLPSQTPYPSTVPGSAGVVTHHMACDRQVALPPGEVEVERPPIVSEPARTYSFELDPFQKEATACIDRGESVLVCAHTSAGKTVCAEHAIAAALRAGQRAIYCSPIKALSNQKFREFQASFGDVGLVTGDVTISAEASCLVVTTEVLRVMLYNGSAVVREAKWIIIDEVHLLGSPDRGWVIEETCILLPASVRFVLLSATVSNALEVAEWVAGLHAHPVHVVSTHSRPTPLRHYACPVGGRGLHLVQSEDGHFDSSQWQSAVSALPVAKASQKREAAACEPAAAEPQRQRPSRAAEVIRNVGHFSALGMLPAIVFCFSRRECEQIAMQMSKALASAACTAPAAPAAPAASAGAAAAASSVASGDGERAPPQLLLSAAEVAQVEQIYDGAVALLADEDAKLPQVAALLPLLRAGVGLHHSGMLPILRELVEILFAEGMLRVRAKRSARSDTQRPICADPLHADPACAHPTRPPWAKLYPRRTTASVPASAPASVPASVPVSPTDCPARSPQRPDRSPTARTAAAFTGAVRDRDPGNGPQLARAHGRLHWRAQVRRRE